MTTKTRTRKQKESSCGDTSRPSVPGVLSSVRQRSEDTYREHQETRVRSGLPTGVPFSAWKVLFERLAQDIAQQPGLESESLKRALALVLEAFIYDHSLWALHSLFECPKSELDERGKLPQYTITYPTQK